VADRFGLSADDRAAMLPGGGQAVYKNRIGWAQDSLKRVLCTMSTKDWRWQATDAGRTLAAEYPDGLPNAKVKEISRARANEKMADILAGKPAAPPTAATGDLSTPDASTPEDRLRLAAAEIRERTIAELLDRLHVVEDAFFEVIVLDVLFAMGYGESREALRRVGGPGDGGIDGIVPLDKLGLQKVYVQAKRWKSSVGNKELLNFIGALSARGADKGVLMTTSEFTKTAVEVVGQSKHDVALVNGRRLAELMIDHGVGTVTRGTYVATEVSKDYFE
jgi:restriction system protein